MGWKTSKGFVSSERRIKRIEEIPLIYGFQTSGAVVRFASKENFPSLGPLTKGGFATDFIMRRDNERRRMIIPGISDISDTMIDAEQRARNQTDAQGVLASGVSNGLKPNLDQYDDKDVFVFWHNGNWNVIKKDYTKEGYIPVELARKVINSTRTFRASDILPRLDKQRLKHTDYESVSSRDMARLMSMEEDLYSRWEFEGVLHIMLNTHMKDGPYLLKRWNDKIEIVFNVGWESVTNGTIPVRNRGMDHTIKGQYHKAIIEGFRRWGASGPYRKIPDSPSNLGVDTINVSVEVKEQSREIRNQNVINVINKFDERLDNNNPRQRQVSNIVVNNWRINNIGKVTMFNFFEEPSYVGGHYEGYNREAYVVVAAHEFGHLLGLGDAHGTDTAGNQLTTATKDLTQNSIMWDGTQITYIEIEMVFLAALKNEMQFFNNAMGRESQAIITRR